MVTGSSRFESQAMYHWVSSPHQELPDLKRLELMDTYRAELTEYLGSLFATLGSGLEHIFDIAG